MALDLSRSQPPPLVFARGSAVNGESYVPLWCKSTYAFLEGASHPDELVEEAHRLGIRSLALTDRDGVYGLVRAHKKAAELGVHLIAGSEVTLDDDSTIVLLAANRDVLHQSLPPHHQGPATIAERRESR